MINKINRNNYEVFFIDYLDGNLTPTEEEMLRMFLNQNPDLAQELTSLQNIKLQPVDAIFSTKSSLKKQESINGISDNFEYLCIAKIEEDITENEQIELNKLLKNDKQKQSILKLYQKLKLKPNNALVYKHKTHLKRIKLFSLSYNNIRSIGSIAAALVLFFAVSSLLLPPLFKVDPQLAIETQIVPSTPDTNYLIPIEEPEKPETIVNKKKMQPSINIITKNVEPEKIIESNIYTDNSYQHELKSIERVAYTNLTVPSQTLSLQKLSGRIENIDRLLAVSEPIDEPRAGTSRELGLFELAQLGVKGLSNLTGANIALNAEKDNIGRISKVNFESTLFAVSVPIKNK
jgi:hypothetical protein